jgi:hypothetical protein
VLIPALLGGRLVAERSFDHIVDEQLNWDPFEYNVLDDIDAAVVVVDDDEVVVVVVVAVAVAVEILMKLLCPPSTGQ